MNYIITKDDCKKNPILKKMGLKEGDTVQFVDVPFKKTTNEEDNGDDPGGGGNHPKKPGNP